MSQQELCTDLCKKCFIKKFKPSKKEISKIILTEYKMECSCCHREDYIVDEDYYYEED